MCFCVLVQFSIAKVTDAAVVDRSSILKKHIMKQNNEASTSILISQLERNNCSFQFELSCVFANMLSNLNRRIFAKMFRL
jgi:hypothetical protein